MAFVFVFLFLRNDSSKVQYIITLIFLFQTIYFCIYTCILMCMFTLLSVYIHTHNSVLKHDFTDAGILSSLVALLFCSSAICTIFIRALPPVSHRHVYLLKRKKEKQRRGEKNGLMLTQNSMVHEFKFIIPTLSL